MTFSDEERTEWIGALTKTADMVELLLDALDRLRVSRGRPAADRW